MNKKVQLLLWIDSSLDAKFRSLIQQKYQKYERGLLSYEAEMALRHWLASHAETQNTLDPKLPNPPPKVWSQFRKIKEFLLDGLYHELNSGQQIPTVHLTRAIENVSGSDPRTIKKWLKTFHKNGLIKPVTSAAWEVM